jgi:hypothetical protein
MGERRRPGAVRRLNDAEGSQMASCPQTAPESVLKNCHPRSIQLRVDQEGKSPVNMGQPADQ